jgi:hypothetical protein
VRSLRVPRIFSLFLAFCALSLFALPSCVRFVFFLRDKKVPDFVQQPLIRITTTYAARRQALKDERRAKPAAAADRFAERRATPRR